MTDSERITKLEQIIQRYEDYFTWEVSQEGDPYVWTKHGFHICTKYYADQPRASGAVFSVATDVHKFAAYFAKDNNQAGPEHNVDGPVIYLENTRPAHSNWGMEIECANGEENIAVFANAQHSAAGIFPNRNNAIVIGNGNSEQFVGIGMDGVWFVNVPIWRAARAIGAAFDYIKTLWEI